MFDASATLGLGRSLLGEYASVVAGAMRQQNGCRDGAPGKTVPAGSLQADDTSRSHLESIIRLARLISDREQHSLSDEDVRMYARHIELASITLLRDIEERSPQGQSDAPAQGREGA